MEQEILHRIALQTFVYEDNVCAEDSSLEGYGLNGVELFSRASQIARKIIGQNQDPTSRRRAGELFARNKNTKELEVRRFSLPVSLGNYRLDGFDLFSRVTVAEKNVRTSPQKRFQASGYGSIAVKLFSLDSENKENQLHLAMCAGKHDFVEAKIDTVAQEPQRALRHIIYLLEKTKLSI